MVSLLAHCEFAPETPDPPDTLGRFDRLYSEHFAFVWRNLRRLGVPEAGLRDASQDAFLVVHRRLAEFDRGGRARAWLYSILRRVAADHRRRQRRKDPVGCEDADTVADAWEPGPEKRAALGEEVRVLLRLLGHLDEGKRDVLILVDLEGMSVPEAASALEVNLNTVYARLRAARRVMRSGLERYRTGEGSNP